MHRGSSPIKYDQAYRDVLAACQRCGESPTVSRLVQPWDSLQMLRTTDRQILADLVKRGHALADELCGRRRRQVRIAHTLALICLLVVLNGTVVWLATNRQSVDGLSRWVRVTFYEWHGFLTSLTLLQQSGALAAVVVVLGFIFLRSTRTD